MERPIVSVLMANYNGGPFIDDALQSVRRQTLSDIEILFVDDASTDASADTAELHSRQDPRIRVMRLPRNCGPSAARNAGLAVARGRWIAIFDSDDMMHPDRLRSLVEEAENAKADICADNLLVFGDGVTPIMLATDPGSAARWITTAEYIRSNRLLARDAPLGYLKPLLSSTFLRQNAMSYEPALRIGEDYDLVVRMLLRGARYRFTGSLGYFYRKHQRSTSHRISADELNRLLSADTALDAFFLKAGPEVEDARRARRRSIERGLGFTQFVSALKQRNWSAAIKEAIRRPSILPLLADPISARARRLFSSGRQGAPASEKCACVISRQRLIGSRSGNSAYLLSLCKSLRGRGYRVTLISPSPAMFGRWPFLFLDREMDVFDRIFIRGSWRLGRRLFFARDPRVLLAAALTVAEKLMLRARLVRKTRMRPAPYAIAVPWSHQDELFIAAHAPARGCRAVIADYAFLTPGIPYAVCPSAKRLVIMHDLFSARAARFGDLNLTDTVASLDEARELELLRQSDAVVAIQETEGKFVAERLPGHRVIVAPMAIVPVRHPQPGKDDTVLFVGTNTAPNVIGLRWFLEHVWPKVRNSLPRATLLVAGSVCDHARHLPDGVLCLGFVRDLDGLYAETGVVISPLTVGSGLKIKLVEAMAHGKAVLATSVTAEGVEDKVRAGVLLADDPAGFSDALCRLLRDSRLREEQGRKALDIAKQWFSEEACYGELLDFIEQDRLPSPPPVAGEQHGPEKAATSRLR